MSIYKLISDGLELNFPDDNVTLLDLSKNNFSDLFKNFKIMDCSWFGNNELWLIEFKVYYDPLNPKHNTPDLSRKNVLKEKITELLQKTVGTLLLVNDRFATIEKFPNGIGSAAEINVLHILKVKPEHKQMLIRMNNELKIKFRPYREIFKTKACVIIAYEHEDTFLNLLAEIEKLKRGDDV